MSKIEIAFVCVNYDGFHYTQKMIDSLLQQNELESSFDISIVVVDNSPESRSDIVSFCEAQRKVTYVRSEINAGYFSGLNLGISKLPNDKYRFVVACNNDLFFDRDFCARLVHMVIRPNTQVICPNVITKDGIHQNPHHLNSLSRWEILAFDCYFSCYFAALILLKIKSVRKIFPRKPAEDGLEHANDIEINQGVGACYILTENFFRLHNGLFFPSFLYGEEASLSWQVRNSGGHLIYNKTLLVDHSESAALSKLPTRQTYGYGKKSYWLIRKYLF